MPRLGQARSLCSACGKTGAGAAKGMGQRRECGQRQCLRGWGLGLSIAQFTPVASRHRPPNTANSGSRAIASSIARRLPGGVTVSGLRNSSKGEVLPSAPRLLFVPKPSRCLLTRSRISGILPKEILAAILRGVLHYDDFCVDVGVFAYRRQALPQVFLGLVVDDYDGDFGHARGTAIRGRVEGRLGDCPPALQPWAVSQILRSDHVGPGHCCTVD